MLQVSFSTHSFLIDSFAITYCCEYCVPFAIMFFLHALILYDLLEEVIFRLYYFYTTNSRSVYAQRGHGHRFRSVCFPAFHVPHRTSRPLGWDSRGKNTVALVFLALVSPPLGIRKALKDCSLKAYFILLFADYIIS